MLKRECRWAERSFWAMAAGQEEEGDKTRVQTHLRDCPACQVQWEAVQQTRSGLLALRDRPVPATQTNWQQVQAQIIADPEHAPVVPQRLRSASFLHKYPVGGRSTLAGAAIALAACLVIGTACLWHGANSRTQTGAFVFADGHNKSYPLKSSLMAQTTMSARVVTRTAAMSTTRRAALSRETDEPQRDNAEAAQYRNASHVRRYNPSRGRMRMARQDARRRRRWVAAALHSRLQAELAAALRIGRSPEPTASLRVATVTRIGQIEPEYVMTTIETDAPTPRRFIMDSINVNAQGAGQSNVDGLAVSAAPDNQSSAATATKPTADPNSRQDTAL